MGISLVKIDAHIVHWEAELRKTLRPYRANWPSRLFRHEPLEGAAAILRDGLLKSRVAAGPAIQLDVAPDEIINMNDAAHDLVRLYFRPRTPTQYRIEGIRKVHEYYQEKHAPTICMLLFSARKILTRPDVKFSSGNMQRHDTEVFDDEQGFDQIDFPKVYHEGPYDSSNPANHDVVTKRCAEVLCQTPLALDDSLQAVICRSHGERQTLLNYLGSAAHVWSPKIKIFSEAGLFCADYAYIESVDISPGGLRINFHPRKDGALVNVAVWCQGTGAGLPSYHWEPTDRAVGPGWNFTCGALPPGRYQVRIDLEGVRAYQADLELEAEPF